MQGERPIMYHVQVIKRRLYKPFLAVVLTIFVGLWAGCDGDEVTDNTNLGKGSDYPPLVSNVAETTFEMVDGSTSKISDRKGKVVLINLWATWCGYCRQEMPRLIAMQNQYRDKSFVVLGLDIGEQDTAAPESIEAIQNFASMMGLNYELARIDSGLRARFQQLSRFSGVPQSFLVDREGRLRGVFLGGSQGAIAQMESVVAKVVNEEG